MKVKVEYVAARSTDEMRAIVMHLTALSCWFEVEPQPNDEYCVSAKMDLGAVAFPADMHRFQYERSFE